MDPHEGKASLVLASMRQELHDNDLVPITRSYATAQKGVVTKVFAGAEYVVLTRIKSRADMGDEAIVDIHAGDNFRIGLFLQSFEACKTLAAMSVVKVSRANRYTLRAV